MIHCIGDSHSAVFSGEEKMQPTWPEQASNLLPYFKSYRIGPATAYQLANKQPLIEYLINTINLTENDSIMFCFGEVDIRAHLIKQSQLQDKPVSELVVECVDRYITSLLNYKKFTNNILVWGPIASWSDKKVYTGGPSYGTNKERNEVTEQFNNYLKDKCEENSFKFITIFDKMLNNDYTTKEDLLDDWEGSHMHLSQRAMPIIIETFKVEGLI